MGMYDIGAEIRQLRDRFPYKRIARSVSVGLLRCIKTGICNNLIRKLVIFSIGIFGRADLDLRAVIAHHIIGVIHHYINNSVNDRRKGFI